MALGFAIMGISTIMLAFISIPNAMIWALVLFLTRVGAASAEIMLETYFFKTVPPRDTAALGMFRITRPLAYFIAPMITMIGLTFTTNDYLFVIIGLISLLAIYPSLKIKDTK
jgi:MFS family permease